EAQRLLRGPFPSATYLVVDAEPAGPVSLDSVHSEMETLWTFPDHRRFGHYRTVDGATVEQVIDAAEAALERAIINQHPESLWSRMSGPTYDWCTYRVPLMSRTRLDELLITPPGVAPHRSPRIA